jgi:hypothetical protein
VNYWELKNARRFVFEKGDHMEDSKSATSEHIATVNRIGAKFVVALKNRLIVHDKSKLKEPEKKYLDVHTVGLKGSIYMSDEYKETLQKMSPGLAHHYSHNDHHPQKYKNGVAGMSLLAITEMLIDWCAAVQRHEDGDILVSIEENQKRYKYSDELKQIFLNTVKEMKCL